MTQSTLMRPIVVFLLGVFGFLPASAQVAADEPVAVQTEHPRLFLRPQRLRLLKRERERTSMRWQQFETLLAGGAPMPEKGFALALYYQVSGDAAYGRQAVAWALGQGADLRQTALVFDWCQDLLSDPQRQNLAARLQQGIAAASANDSVASIRSQAMAAIALYDHVPQVPQRELQRIVRTWWVGKIVPALKAGKSAITRDDAYPLFELLHAIRDNTNIDLRESYGQFFKDYPVEHLISHYPAVYPGPDTDYYIGAESKAGDPDLQVATLSRAGGLAMVAYDVNAAETQVLQGWLMHDRFLLKSTFGTPYEFLWANPYQPGLSYFHVPLIYHNPDFGKLFIRSSWDDTAKWLGYFDGVIQVFEEGHLSILNPQLQTPPIEMKEAVVCFGATAQKFSVNLDEEEAVFLIGLQPRHWYQVEIDDEEVFEEQTDPGGILVLNVPHGKVVGVRIRESNSGAE
jgi:hypothetical protein